MSRGQKPHVPNDALRQRVESLASFGTPQERIAKLIGISKPTLHKYYADIIEIAEDKANSMVADSLFAQAVGRPAVYDNEGRKIRSEQKRNIVAGIFWAKTRMRWREVYAADDKDDNTININVVRGGLPQRKRDDEA